MGQRVAEQMLLKLILHGEQIYGSLVLNTTAGADRAKPESIGLCRQHIQDCRKDHVASMAGGHVGFSIAGNALGRYGRVESCELAYPIA